MTTPEVRTFKKNGSRFYVHPVSDKSAPGVTSVLNALPKPFLKYWASKVVAEHAVDNAGALVNMLLTGDKQGAVDWLKRAPDRSTGGSANVGTEVHDLYEQLSKGKKIGRVHPDIKPFVDNWHEWNEEFQPEFLFVEETVWAEEYAGSFDWIAEIHGQTVIGDYKTTKSGVHEEVCLQLWAYANADEILHPDGSTSPLPEITGAAVMHSRPEGWQFVPVSLDDMLGDVFRALLVVSEWDKGGKRGVLGKAIGSGERG